MRSLILVRHAEAAPAAPGGDDYSRRLTERGIAQAQQLRQWATDASALGQYGPVTALVSAAARTRQTFREAFEETPFVHLSYESELIYNGRRDVSAEDLLIELQAIDPVSTSLLVVGHNPTMTELLWTLTGSLPASARDGAPLASAYVVALPDDAPVGLAHYDLVTAYLPD